MHPHARQSGGAAEGFELAAHIRRNAPEMPLIMMAETEKRWGGQKNADIAMQAIRTGCSDLLVKPLDAGRLEELLDTYLPNHQLSMIGSAEEDTRSLYAIVGRSAKLEQTISLARKVAPTSVPVLISGESGTGKELISYLIHHRSRRSQGPYVRVNCAALSDSLLESELFGHEKGAFTGAHTQRKGRFEMAHGGTLLLDEISETPLKFQAKLLRVLEQQDFERVGGNQSVKVDVRIISTTNRDLAEHVRGGNFRPDLYYRLSAVRLLVPPLRQRQEDLADLVWHFVNLYARQTQRQITRLDPPMMDIFAKYHWPGNIRQLRNVVLTSLILGVGSTLSLADVSWLFDELQPLQQENPRGLTTPPEASLPEQDTGGADLGGVPLVELEQRAILDTLRHTAGNQTKAAKVLGISDRTLRDKIKKYREEGVLQS
jgi:two-component system response regulator HydG